VLTRHSAHDIISELRVERDTQARTLKRKSKDF